ncbi:hypothetical protein D3C81_1967680 [compost metagenome]
MPGVAERGAVAGLLLIDHDHAQPLASQTQCAGDADDAGADHGDVVGAVIRHGAALPFGH